MRASLVDGHDRRVLDRGSEPQFADEPILERLIGRQGGRQELERDRALQGQVGRPEDDAHPATPDQGVEAIPPEDRAEPRDVAGLCPIRRHRVIVNGRPTNGECSRWT